jgi:hypothetical protein
MIDPETVPEATSPPEHHADFLELSAIRSRTRGVAFLEFVRDLKMASATEAIADTEAADDGSEIEDRTDALAQSAFDELDERRRSCGKETEIYPFEVSDNSVRLKKEADKSLYTFLALLSWFGKDAGPKETDGEKIFEEICAKAAETYLGGPGRCVRSYIFGFPRRTQPSGFADALDNLCSEMGEGGSHHKGRPKLPNQKDGKLDIVAWKEFEDKRQGKLITFGQCATGRNWDEKISELPPPDRWCGHWMAETPTVLPVRSFFVPHRIERDSWSHTCTFAGILYDRCRIASFAPAIVPTLQTTWAKWSSHVLKEIRRTRT